MLSKLTSNNVSYSINKETFWILLISKLRGEDIRKILRFQRSSFGLLSQGRQVDVIGLHPIRQTAGVNNVFGGVTNVADAEALANAMTCDKEHEHRLLL